LGRPAFGSASGLLLSKIIVMEGARSGLSAERGTEGAHMSQANPLRSIGGLALEIGAVAAVVMLLPKINLQPSAASQPSGSAIQSAAADPAPPAWWQQAPQAAPTSWEPANPSSGPISVSAPPLTSPQIPPAAASHVPSPPARSDRSSIGSFSTDSPTAYPVERTNWQPPQSTFQRTEQPAAAPQYVEQTLDRASQNLLSGVSEYLFPPAESARIAPPETQRQSAYPRSAIPPATSYAPSSGDARPSFAEPAPPSSYTPAIYPPPASYTPVRQSPTSQPPSFAVTPVSVPSESPAAPTAAPAGPKYQPQLWRRY
jgi:hypothetical protein